MNKEYRVWAKLPNGKTVCGEWGEKSRISSVFDSVARSLRGAEIGVEKRVTPNE